LRVSIHAVTEQVSHGLYTYSASLKMPIHAHFFGSQFWPVK